MTTVHHLREAMARPASTVSIAGVPWPVYKLVALVAGLLVCAVVAAATAAAGPAVLSGAGVATLLWVVLGTPTAANR